MASLKVSMPRSTSPRESFKGFPASIDKAMAISSFALSHALHYMSQHFLTLVGRPLSVKLKSFLGGGNGLLK